jgi:hypothetical protein
VDWRKLITGRCNFYLDFEQESVRPNGENIVFLYRTSERANKSMLNPEYYQKLEILLCL